MQVGTKIGIGVGIGAAALLGGAAALAATRGDGAGAPDGEPPATRRAVAPGSGTSPGDDPVMDYPGGGTSPGDGPIAMPVRGLIDPPGIWNDHAIDGHLMRDRLDATIDPPGPWNDVHLTGRVDHGGWRTQVDPAGFGNTTHVTGRHSRDGYRGTVDRPGFGNTVDHPIRETIRGAQVLREGRFDEPFVPGFSEATWNSRPIGSGIEGRILEFDPPGWGNTTRVTLDSSVPAGVEATIAARLYDEWATELERQADYPDPDYPAGPGYPGDPGYPADPWPGGTAPGDDGGYPTSPGDDGGFPFDPAYPVVP